MITWHEKGPYSFYASIQGMTIDLEAYGRKWHVSIGNNTVFTLPTSITADKAKAAAEKELIELFEDAINALVDPGKQAVMTKEQILSKHLLTYVTKTQKEQIFAAMDEYKSAP